jgi:hypothetical protein
MAEHPSKTELIAYADRALSADAVLRVDNHLSRCHECYLLMKEHLNIGQAGASLAESLAGNGHDDHLSYEQLAGYVDGSLGAVDREIAEVHSGACELCSAQLDDLRKIRDGFTAEPVPQLSRRPSFLEGIGNAISLKWAVPVFAVLVLVFAWFRWPATQNKPVEEVAVNTKPADQIAQVPVNVPEPPAANGVNANAAEPVKHPEVTLVDAGGRVELDAAGNLSGINAGRFAPALKAVLSGGDIQVSPDARNLRSSAGVLMGGGDTGVPFKLTGPVGKVVESDHPQFSWRPVEGADGYTVSIYDDNYSKVATSPVLKQTSWSPGSRLKRGTSYKWQVTATKDGQEIKSPVRPAPDARFKVLSAADAADIETAKRQAGSSHLLLGMVYAKAGLLTEAEKEFGALLKQNPNSELARKLLNKVKAAR